MTILTRNLILFWNDIRNLFIVEKDIDCEENGYDYDDLENFEDEVEIA